MHTAGTAFRSRIPSIKKRFITELRSLCCISGSIYLPPTRLFVSFRFDLSIVNVWRRNSTHHNQNFSALLFNCRLRLMWQQYFFFQSLATVIFDFWPEIQYAMVTSKKRGDPIPQLCKWPIKLETYVMQSFLPHSSIPLRFLCHYLTLSTAIYVVRSPICDQRLIRPVTLSYLAYWTFLGEKRSTYILCIPTYLTKLASADWFIQ